MTISTIYLDYQASTPIDPRVSELVTSVSVASFANPHAEDHAAGWSAASVVEQARSRICLARGFHLKTYKTLRATQTQGLRDSTIEGSEK